MTKAACALVLVAASAAAAERPTCDPERIDAKSYRLTTKAVAYAVTQERHRWWDSFDLGKYEDDLDDLNSAVTHAAERALEIDARNLLAHSILARQYLVLDEPEQADAAWRVVMDAGGAVVWTATLYDVDARSYFFMAFDRKGIRIYRFGQMTERLEKGFYDIPKFPPAADERFWAAGGGCIPEDVRPEASVPWADVKEIKGGNYVLWFKLARPITVSSDRNKKKDLKEIKVALHGRTGSLETYKPVGEEHLEMRGRGPWGYNELIRRTLVKFVDPEKRIALPASKPGVGW